MSSHPRDLTLQGLLRFAMEHTKSEDAPNESAYKQMDEEKRRFLDSAIKAMTVDVLEEFEKAITTLENTEASLESKKNAFEVVRDYIDNMDFANNFIKVGGGKVIIKYLSHEEDKLKIHALNIIAEMAQNNPFSQAYFLNNEKILPTILNFIKSSKADVANSAIYTASSLIRSYEPGLVEFLNNDGVQITLTCLNSSDSRVFIKACFLIANLSSEFAIVRDQFVQKLDASQIVDQLETITGFDIKLETILLALTELTKSSQWNPGTEINCQILDVLQEIVEKNDQLPESDEIVKYANDVIHNLKTFEAIN